jgi:uroporphyrinogen decarboxylase
MEAFGRVHQCQRNYRIWDQMEPLERELHRRDVADLYIAIAGRFEHSAIYLQRNPNTEEETFRLIDLVREMSGDRYFLAIPGDPTFSIPSGEELVQFVYRLTDEPEKVKAEAEARVAEVLNTAERLQRHGGLDGFIMTCDYCFNAGPFLSPAQFGEFVTPYLAKTIQGYRDLGFYAIKHTDGNIMPILDQLVQANPHALHSLDPQAGVDIAEVKRRYGKQLCLIGNVNCGLLDTGTDEEVAASARYALKHGMRGDGYIFSTSNGIYTGMRLKRYEQIREIWRREGNY